MANKSKSCVGRTGEPLTEYCSQVEAQRGADHVNLLHGKRLLPYRCDSCHRWHLAPEDRHTPSTKCGLCVDGRGSMKELYPSEEIAEKRAEILRREQGVSLKAYPCPYSDGWHLTSR